MLLLYELLQLMSGLVVSIKTLEQAGPLSKCGLFICEYLSSFYEVLFASLKGRQRYRKISYLLIHPLNACNSWGWATPMTGAWNSIQISPLGVRDASTWAIMCCCPGVHLKAGQISDPRTLIGNVGYEFYSPGWKDLCLDLSVHLPYTFAISVKAGIVKKVVCVHTLGAGR